MCRICRSKYNIQIFPIWYLLKTEITMDRKHGYESKKLYRLYKDYLNCLMLFVCTVLCHTGEKTRGEAIHPSSSESSTGISMTYSIGSPSSTNIVTVHKRIFQFAAPLVSDPDHRSP